MRTRLFHAVVGVAFSVGCGTPDRGTVTKGAAADNDASTDAADAVTDAPTDADAEDGWPPTK